MVRPWHLVESLGASPWHIRGRLRHLAEHGLAHREIVAADLTDPKTGRVRASTAHIWRITGRGATHAGPWVVGTYDGVTRELPAVRTKAIRVDHTLGITDLYSWYVSVWGAASVATEREITSLEIPPRRGARPAITPVWTTLPADALGQHSPDLAFVTPDGHRFAAELERAQKSAAEYQRVVSAYVTAGLGQIWHVASNKTAGRIFSAAASIGHPLTQVGSAYVSSNGQIRMQGWTPGRTGTGGPETWKGNIPAFPPAGLPAPASAPDLTASWKRGAYLDPERIVFEADDWWATA